MTESDAALMLGGDLLVTIFEVGCLSLRRAVSEIRHCKGQCKRLPLPSWPEAVVKTASESCMQASQQQAPAAVPALLPSKTAPQHLRTPVWCRNATQTLSLKPSTRLGCAGEGAAGGGKNYAPLCEGARRQPGAADQREMVHPGAFLGGGAPDLQVSPLCLNSSRVLQGVFRLGWPLLSCSGGCGLVSA